MTWFSSTSGQLPQGSSVPMWDQVPHTRLFSVLVCYFVKVLNTGCSCLIGQFVYFVCLPHRTISSSPGGEWNRWSVSTNLETCIHCGWLALSEQWGICQYMWWISNIESTVHACELATVIKLLILIWSLSRHINT